MSHVIPLWLFQVLKSDRWNCNVFSDPKKSEGTQITCDFWGGRGRGEAGEGEAGGRDEAGARLRIAGTWWPGRGRGRGVPGTGVRGGGTDMWADQ